MALRTRSRERESAAERGERLERLAGAARSGDSSAFERLVRETSPQVNALVLRLVGDEHDAGDVVQETYLRAFASIHRFRSEAAVTTWLYRIAANCSATHLARRRPTLAIEDAPQVADQRQDQDPEAVASGADDRARLEEALARLPEGLRAVVILHDVYELSHEAVGAELGISKAASKVRLHRARRRLRDLLFPEAARGAADQAGRGTSDAPAGIAPLRPGARGKRYPASRGPGPGERAGARAG